MKSTNARTAAAPVDITTTEMLARRLRTVIARRADDILAEVPATLRRVRTFLVVLSISVPLFLGGLVAAMWHFAH